MDNETTMPAVLTQPDVLPAPAESEPVNPAYFLIFVATLLAVVALVYFI